MENKIIIRGLLLTESDAIIIPCLAIIGAATIVTAVGNVTCKLGKKIINHLVDKKRSKLVDTKLEKTINEFIEFMKKEES